jgi:hypothetical protein
LLPSKPALRRVENFSVYEFWVVSSSGTRKDQVVRY